MIDAAELKRQRWLKAIVIGLGLLILVAMGIMVTAILTRHPKPVAPERPSPASSRPNAAPEQGFGDIKAAWPKGAKFEDMKVAEGEIFIRITLPTGATKLLVYSAQTGHQLGSIEFTAE